MTKNLPKICLVSSAGGHLFHLKRLEPWWSSYPHFWVTRNSLDAISMIDHQDNKYFAYFPEQRNFVNFIKNILLAIKIIATEKPDIIVSSGAGVAPPFFFVGKLLGCKLIFIEVFDFIKYPTLSGRLIYPISDLFLVQHKLQLKPFPRARFVGSLL